MASAVLSRRVEKVVGYSRGPTAPSALVACAKARLRATFPVSISKTSARTVERRRHRRAWQPGTKDGVPESRPNVAATDPPEDS